jgi:hypothetical protein
MVNSKENEMIGNNLKEHLEKTIVGRAGKCISNGLDVLICWDNDKETIVSYMKNTKVFKAFGHYSMQIENQLNKNQK